MKLFKNIKRLGQGFSETILRFPITVIFLVAATITEAVSIQQEHNSSSDLILTFVMGAALSIVLQMVYERFFKDKLERYIGMGLSLVLTFCFFVYVKVQESDIQLSIQTAVIFFILFIAFLWIPVIKSRINFNESFLATFKAFFTATFFEGVLFLGLILIIGAIDILIVETDYKLYLHFANIIFALFAPVQFLSLIPYYPGKRNMEELKVENKADLEQSEEKNVIDMKSENLLRFTSPGRFLETLITYIILPITAVFTIILLIYIIANIRQDFWTDNLMEPLLISYSITVILVYLLASTLNNTMARLFRSIFPKVLVPIVLFQVVASLLKTREVGITYGRYYVIMFGIFAVISGVIFCFKSVHKNGLIAPVLIVLSLISILPFVNAFTLCREVQENRLQKVLEQNNMLVGQKVVPRPEISKNDKEIIISSIEYLEEVDAIDRISWLSEYKKSQNFEVTFGFSEYEDIGKNQFRSIYRDTRTPIPVEGYDYMMRTYINEENEQMLIEDSVVGGNTFSLYKEGNELILKDLAGEALHFSIDQLYDKASKVEEYDTNLDTQELIFTEENSTTRLTVIADNITIDLDSDNNEIQADIYVLIDFK